MVVSVLHYRKLAAHVMSIAAAFIVPCISFAQFLQPSDTLHKPRTLAVSCVVAAGYPSSLIALGTVWYADYPQQDFHLFNDNDQWLQMDKAGHGIASYQLSRYGYEAMHWAGVPENSSVWLGSGSALLFLTGLEVLDGFSSGWGFSIGDMVANVGGSAIFLAQQRLWQEQRMALKISYSPSNFAQYRPELLGATSNERILKDYNGQTAWLSINPSAFAKSAHPRLPWLSLALGYSGKGMLGGSGNPPFNMEGVELPVFPRQREFYLSFDVDLSRIPTNSHLLKTIFSLVGFIKIPAPALELSNGNLAWHWLYF